LLNTQGVEFIGEISEREKNEFPGNAMALLFPVDWPEPFGLVMIEALACGTPVIARPCGSVPEVVHDGLTGFIASSIDDLVRAVARLPSISRQRCRAEFDGRFTAKVMAANYERIYYRLIDDRRSRSRPNEDRPAHNLMEEMIAGEGTQGWRRDLETA
jgi:glycosyltransferase involved in cell wall biosynthesis